MTELQFYNLPDPGATNKAKSIYVSKKKILNQEFGSRLDSKIQEIFQGCYKLNFDQLLDMHDTQS